MAQQVTQSVFRLSDAEYFRRLRVTWATPSIRNVSIWLCKSATHVRQTASAGTYLETLSNVFIVHRFKLHHTFVEKDTGNPWIDTKQDGEGRSFQIVVDWSTLGEAIMKDIFRRVAQSPFQVQLLNQKVLIWSDSQKAPSEETHARFQLGFLDSSATLDNFVTPKAPFSISLPPHIAVGQATPLARLPREMRDPAIHVLTAFKDVHATAENPDKRIISLWLRKPNHSNLVLGSAETLRVLPTVHRVALHDKGGGISPARGSWVDLKHYYKGGCQEIVIDWTLVDRTVLEALSKRTPKYPYYTQVFSRAKAFVWIQSSTDSSKRLHVKIYVKLCRDQRSASESLPSSSAADGRALPLPVPSVPLSRDPWTTFSEKDTLIPECGIFEDKDFTEYYPRISFEGYRHDLPISVHTPVGQQLLEHAVTRISEEYITKSRLLMVGFMAADWLPAENTFEHVAVQLDRFQALNVPWLWAHGCSQPGAKQFSHLIEVCGLEHAELEPFRTRPIDFGAYVKPRIVVNTSRAKNQPGKTIVLEIVRLFNDINLFGVRKGFLEALPPVVVRAERHRL